ncbi:MAG: hypothetical protein M3Y87_13310 [Myxococcota bacterium]|nr:hypothetical protein [Myxococcota bacterium]
MLSLPLEVTMGLEDLRAIPYWSEVEGRRAVELWRKSGASLRAFAARTGVPAARFSYWRKRLGAATQNTLAPVTVIPARRANALSIELRSGRAIRIDGGFDDDVPERAITIAEARGVLTLPSSLRV